MAKIACVSPRTYQAYEMAETPIPSTVVVKIAAFFELNIHELFWGKPYPVSADAKESYVEMALEVMKAVMQKYDDPQISAQDAKE